MPSSPPYEPLAEPPWADQWPPLPPTPPPPFDAPTDEPHGRRPRRTVATALVVVASLLCAAFGFEVTTFVRSAAELRRMVALRPFDLVEGDTYFVTFLKSAPAVTDRRALAQMGNDFDTLVVEGRDVHWRMHGKSTDTKLKTKDWDNIVGRHRSTSRNMNMLHKLADRL